jgi:plasmid stabilization system protein ParE
VARKIVWSDLAVEDLEAAVSFVARDSPGYARSLAQLAIDAAESLVSFADRGHRLPDRTLSRYRELLVGAYRLVYLVEKERVLIVALLHGPPRSAPGNAPAHDRTGGRSKVQPLAARPFQPPTGCA